MALDFAVVNALGPGHHGETFSEPLRAAVGYSHRKSTYGRTKERCEEAGIAFEPMVFEMQGGIEPRAAAILHRIAEAVSATEDLEQEVCKKTMLERLALIIARWSSKMVRRRVPKPVSGRQCGSLKRALTEVYLDADNGA